MSVEAVNSALPSVPVIRVSSDETRPAASVGNTVQVQKAAQGPYVSPVISFDAKAGVTVVEIRNTQTGAVTQTIPSLPNPTANESDQGPEVAQMSAPQTIAVGSSSLQQNNTPSAVSAAQQVAAFATAAQSGDTNAGNVNLIA